MGFFDRFKRKSPASSRRGPDPDYFVAHVALRATALSDPLRFLGILGSPDATRLIDAIIKDVTETVGPPSFGAADVRIHKKRVGAFPCAVLEFPEPRKVAFAHMVAIVLYLDISRDDISEKEPPKARYFTLEKGISITDAPRTVLAEWSEEAHSNYGDGPPVDVDAFDATIEARFPS